MTITELDIILSPFKNRVSASNLILRKIESGSLYWYVTRSDTSYCMLAIDPSQVDVNVNNNILVINKAIAIDLSQFDGEK